MPMPRVIGVSVACLVTSACVVAKAPENNTSDYPGDSAGITLGKSEVPTRGSPSSPCGEAHEGGLTGYAFGRTERGRSSFEFATDVCRDGSGGPCCARMRAAGGRQFGKAAWYDLVGRRTASGEILDTATATAAHRSLPLASFARVTDLDNGRSVIVKINDRGPYTRGRIIDLSPRAADALDMKAAGVAAVVIEPMVNQADLIVSDGSSAIDPTTGPGFPPVRIFQPPD